MIIFKEYVDDLRIKFQRIAKVINEKEIQYGYQFVCGRDNEEVTVSVYYNKKHQFRMVWPQNKNTLCLDLMAELGVKADGDTKIRTLTFDGFDKLDDFQNVWAGSDESGKGDFFGPLVVAAVVVNKDKARYLQQAGVKDCKELTDAKTLELEQVIFDNVLAYSVLELLPEVYNKRYAEEKNLNVLNAKGHFNAIKNVFTKVPEAEGALIDQFLKNDFLINNLQKAFPDKKFYQRPRAENNMAVAAASVLARARFLHSMQDLAKLAGVIELPKGSGVVQANVAKQIAEKFGKDILHKFVKTHFVTYKEI